jgi:periplasmic divalent cation tolerance protein
VIAGVPQDRASVPSESAVRVVLVTVPDVETGRSLAQEVVAARLAACVNVVPGLLSVYRWNGAVHQDPEALLVLKTTTSVVEALMERVLEFHPYEVPEILVLPVEQGHPPYLRWVAGAVEETGTSDGSKAKTESGEDLPKEGPSASNRAGGPPG